VPTIIISSDTDKLKAGESTTITFTLSEISTDFDTTDVVVTGGILTDFVLKETVLYWWIVYLLLDLNQQHLGLW
jgi:hypothetical protein